MDVVGTPKATVALLVLVGALITVGIVHHRRRDRVTATMCLVSAWMVVAGVVSLSVTPGSFVLSPHQMRWLWAVGAFATMALWSARPSAAAPRPLGAATPGRRRGCRRASWRSSTCRPTRRSTTPR